jgi:hypothetical protein
LSLKPARTDVRRASDRLPDSARTVKDVQEELAVLLALGVKLEID